MRLSINPSYKCNFRCSFCYLTPQQLAGKDPNVKNLADINDIESCLKTVANKYDIEHIDLYGGEIGLIPSDYLNSLHEMISKYYDGKINVITNLSVVNPYFLRDDVELSVSYDFQARQSHVKVYNNLIMLPRDVSILVLASREVINMDVDTMICGLNLRNIKSVEIKPYSTNQANQQEVSFRDFEVFVQKWIESEVDKEFTFVNEERIHECLDKRYNAFSDDHIYITPNGTLGVLDFDHMDNEIFVELNSLSDYEVWANKEKARVTSNAICSKCPYLGNCLTEHYRDVKDLDNSCNGFRGLLEWYERHSDV